MECVLRRPKCSLKEDLPYGVEGLFCFQLLNVRLCSSQKHALLDRYPQQKWTLLCGINQFCDYHGDAQIYLHNVVQNIFKLDDISPELCWRKVDDIQLCDKQISAKQIILSYPLFMVFELAHEMVSNESTRSTCIWNFPATISLKLHEEVFFYDIVSRIYYGSNHFTAAVVNSSNIPFSYNDFDGYLKPMNTGYSDAVAGAHLATSYLATNNVCYHLRGGRQMQTHLQEVTRQILQEYSLTVTVNTEDELPYIFWDDPDYAPMTSEAMIKWLPKADKNPAQEYELIEAVPIGDTQTVDVKKQEAEVDVVAKDEEQMIPKMDLDDDKTHNGKVTSKGHAVSSSLFLSDTDEVKEHPPNITSHSSIEIVNNNSEYVQSEELQRQHSQHTQIDVEDNSNLEVQTMTSLPLRTSASLSSVGEEEEWFANCRCGWAELRRGRDIDQDVIQCSECNKWSHKACQYRGYVHFLRPKDFFYCHRCSIPTITNMDIPRLSKTLEYR